MADNELRAEKTGDDTTSLEGATEQSGGLNKKLIIGILVLLLVIGGGAAAYFTGAIDKLLGKAPVNCEEVKEGDAHYEECAAKLEASVTTQGPGVFFEIPDMIVNLSSNAKQPRFLKISLKVELEKAEDQPRFEAVLPRVIDQFQTYLRELRIEDLRGSSGMYRMKIELLSRVRAAAPDLKVRDVLFQEILVQ
jgi:flagellar FliL protein